MLSDPTMGILRDSFIVSNEAKRIAGSITEAQQKILDDLITSLGPNDLKISSTISHHRPASDAILAAALEFEPRFVVKGTHYHSAAERATFAETDWRLIRKLQCPLWFAKPDAWKDNPVIVAAVDPTHRHDKEGTLDQKIVDAGKSLAAKCDGELVLLHTYQRLVEIGTYAMFKFKPVRLPIKELDASIKAEHRRLLDALAAANDIPDDAVHQLPGRTEELLPMFARTEGANLVIMGAVSRSGFRRVAIGSTAERVLDHLHCDILIMHSG